MNKQKNYRRQRGITPITTPRNSPGVAQFSMSEVAQFSMSLDNLRSRRIFLIILVAVIAVGVVGLAARVLVRFPASLLIPLQLMAAAKALFCIWA